MLPLVISLIYLTLLRLSRRLQQSLASHGGVVGVQLVWRWSSLSFSHRVAVPFPPGGGYGYTGSTALVVLLCIYAKYGYQRGMQTIGWEFLERNIGGNKNLGRHVVCVQPPWAEFGLETNHPGISKNLQSIVGS